MNFLDEDAFTAAFQKRMRETRVEVLNWSQPRMAAALGVNLDAYKKYETRAGSAFPLYLLPKLAFITDRSLSYWMGASAESKHPHARIRRVI